MTGGIYIHIPFCTEKCIYCDFYSLTKRENEIDPFIQNLCKEIKLTSQKINIEWIIDTVFIGGGTPSLLEARHIEMIIHQLDESFNINHLEEFTIESNPGEFSYEKMKDFKALGVNRISFGFQSLNDDILKFLTRWHSAKDCIESFNNARKTGFKNINIDMMFGIPNQSVQDWQKDLKHVIDLNPEHISAYSLTVEKQTPLYKYVASNEIIMPHEKVDIDMYSYTMDILNNGDYSQYEISNYSKKNKECKHNLHYWKREPYLAFGPSGHGYNDNQRYWNIRDLNKYMICLDSDKLPIDNSEILNQENIFNEIILNGLRTSEGINVSEIKLKFNTKTLNSILERTDDWSNYIEYNDKRIRLNKKGYFIADEITLDFINSYN